ncbi:MAG TPA: MFS transporter [Iamia sp.]|nr:MFS transporter [Iamia sp.]
MTTTAAPVARVRRGPAHLAVLGAFTALGFAVGSWGARIPDVKDELDLSEGALGTALLGLSVGAVLGAWIGGLLVRRLGSRRVVGGGWIVVGGAVVLPGLAGSWATLAAAELVLGLAVGVLDVSMNGAGVQLEHEAETPLLSGLHAGWSGGVLLGAGLGAVAVGAGLAVDVHLVVVGVLVVVAAVACARQVPDGRIEHAGSASSISSPDGSGAAPPARRGRLAALAAIGGCVFLAEGALLDWSGVLVREDLDGGKLLGALAVTGVSAGGLGGRLAGDRLAAAWGSARLVQVSVAVASVALGLCLLSPVALPVPLLLVVVGAGLAPAVPLAFAAAGRLRGEHGIAVVTTAGYGAYLGGPGIIGGLANATALRWALVLPLALVALVTLLAWSTTD